MISADIGVPFILERTLSDGDTGKGVQGIIKKADGTPVSTVNLTHIGLGTYTGTYSHSTAEYLVVTYVVYTDPTFVTEDQCYERSSKVYRVGSTCNPNTIADAVWDELTNQHTIPNTFGEAINILLSTMSPAGIASAVWDASVFLHMIPNTFGDYVQVIRQYVRDNNDELTDPTWGLDQIYAKIGNEAAATRGEVNQNETKIDAILPAIGAAEGNIVTEIGVNRTDISDLDAKVSTVESNIISEVDQNEVKIDEVKGLVQALQNNTTSRFIVPERLIKPDSGTKDYEFHLRLYDTDNNPEAPDSAPRITIKRLDTGAVIVNDVAMTQDGAKVGAYLYVYSTNSGTAEAHLLVEAKVVENGKTRYIPATTEITEFESDLNALQSQLSTVDTKVTTTNSHITNPTYGLSSLKTGQTNIVGEVDQNEAKIDQIKAKTDLIPADPATETSVASAESTVLTRPDIATIQSRLDNLGDSIRGVGGRTITEVYNLWDISSLLKTNDPRLNYLDVAISSRSTLTAGDVWAQATRTLTGFNLPNSEIKKIWDYLSSQATTPGSLGKIIGDYLDATVSSRATAADVTSMLSGVAQESTVNGLTSIIQNENNENQILLNSILSNSAAIKGKTDNLPATPASNPNVDTKTAELKALIQAMDLLVQAVKAKTDTIPLNPAEEASVQAIPTNPLLDDDARLSNLDVKVSTRSTLDASDLSPLAKSSELAQTESDLAGKIDDNGMKLDAIGTLSTGIKSRTDNLPVDPASNSQIQSSKVEVLDAIDNIPAGGSGGTTPAAVWAHPSRTLTDPETYKADVSDLAKSSELVSPTQYVSRMGTVFKNSNGRHKIIAWAEKDGQRVIGSNCTVTIKNENGLLQWTKTLASPNSDGIFLFSEAVTLGADENYYVIIEIEVGGDTRTSIQPFFTVG